MCQMSLVWKESGWWFSKQDKDMLQKAPTVRGFVTLFEDPRDLRRMQVLSLNL